MAKRTETIPMFTLTICSPGSEDLIYRCPERLRDVVSDKILRLGAKEVEPGKYQVPNQQQVLEALLAMHSN